MKFETAFTALTNNSPFPWQQKWYEHLAAGEFDKIATTSIPTGLGKTSVLACWLIAHATNPAKVPRRLVYVVNRRTVVDQTTTEAENLRKNAEAAGMPIPAISTLRGQFADNREWSTDPSKPAIIAGTVDMVGSRLLFSGYGVGFKARPLHAGFLAQDVLLIHDEAHLEPAFQDLLLGIQQEQQRSRELQKFHVVELSATSRAGGTSFKLSKDDDADERVQKRFRAKKQLRLHSLEDEKKLPEEVTKLAMQYKDSHQAVLVFVQAVADVTKVQDQLVKAKIPRERIETLTGTLRGKERDELVNKPLFKRFVKPPESPEPTVYLICTSAGEVGVNISATHLVTDLTTFDSMAQRFGRVNRFGDSSETVIDVVHPIEFDNEKLIEQRRRKTLHLLTQLNGNASPKSLDKLNSTERQAAFAPAPEILPTSDILFDAWALTSIRDRLPGRPHVAPYLHGVSKFELPETHVAWRNEVWELQRPFVDARDRKQFEKFAEDLLEDYPLKSIELLRDRSDRVFNTLKKIAAAGTTPVWLQSDEGEIEVTTLGEILEQSKDVIDDITIILPPQAGGLENGLLTGEKFNPEKLDQYDVADQWRDKDGFLRKRQWNDDTNPPGMKLERTIQFPNVEEEGDDPDIWYWFVRVPEAPSARSRKEYALQSHLDDAEVFAQGIVTALHLPDDLRRAVVLASQFHDLGKRRKLWQQSIGNRNYPKQEWAKSGQRMAAMDRSRYRHEFGSLLDVWSKAEFKSLAPDQQALVLHLIAAHHGRARPHFPVVEAFDLEGTELDAQECATQIAVRFARLQRKYGRWGLAYLESLVRAADILASQKAEGDSA